MKSQFAASILGKVIAIPASIYIFAQLIRKIIVYQRGNINILFCLRLTAGFQGMQCLLRVIRDICNLFGSNLRIFRNITFHFILAAVHCKHIFLCIAAHLYQIAIVFNFRGIFCNGNATFGNIDRFTKQIHTLIAAGCLAYKAILSIISPR